MAFNLDNRTTNIIEKVTGFGEVQQRMLPLAEYSRTIDIDEKREYRCNKTRTINPRGSVYLLVGRILSLKKVKGYLLYTTSCSRKYKQINWSNG